MNIHTDMWTYTLQDKNTTTYQTNYYYKSANHFEDIFYKALNTDFDIDWQRYIITKQFDGRNKSSQCYEVYKERTFWRISPVVRIRNINNNNLDWWNTTKSQFISLFYFILLVYINWQGRLPSSAPEATYAETRRPTKWTNKFTFLFCPTSLYYHYSI